MPRITRKSLASKEEPEPELSARSSSRSGRGKRGAKAEPAEEEVAVGEPQELPPKRGRQAAKTKETESPKPAARGRAARGRSTRGGRGKKEEPEEEEEVEEEMASEEEEEEKPKRGSSRSQSRGRGAKGGRGARSTSRGGKKKAPESDEEEEEEEQEEEVTYAPVEKRGRGKKGKAAAPAKTPPTPRAGRRGRGKAAAAEPEEEEEEEGPADSEAAKEEPEEKSTPHKEVEEAASAPSSVGRRSGGRSRRSVETAPKTPPARSSRRSGGAAAAAAETKKDEAKEEEEEPMEAETEPSPAETSEAKPEAEAAVKPASQETPEAEREAASKKRKLDHEEESNSSVSKKPRTSDSTPSEEERTEGQLEGTSTKETSGETRMEEKAEKEEEDDFVVVNKEDVPAADSKEVTEILPPVVAEKTETARVTELTTTEKSDDAESSRSDSGDSPADMAAPAQIPMVVPLTEAELAKQYTETVRDREETSSIAVEVGSEAASDITGVSARGLDISDAQSMDSTSTEQNLDIQPVAADQDMDTDTPAPPSQLLIPTVTVTPAPTSPREVTSEPAATNNNQDVATFDASQNKTVVTDSSNQNTPSVSQQAPVTACDNVCQNAKLTEEPEVPKIVENSCSLQQSSSTSVNDLNDIPMPPAPPVAPSQPASQHGTQNGVTQPTSIPSKPASVSVRKPPPPLIENYVASSPSITKRKFIPNPTFPAELMDPAYCFSLVTYNILADCHMRRVDYSYTEPQFLDQSYRHSLLVKELDYLDSDIVCLQEVNPQYYTQTLLPHMMSRGYQGQFMARTKPYWDEGEATFFRTSKFELLSHQGVSLRDLAFKEVDAGNLSEEVKRAAKKHLDRADVVLLCKFQCRKTGKIVTVANIHVVYDLTAPDVQCVQVACAMKELVAKAGSDLNPHIICGDFNSEVGSPSYQLAKEGYLSDTHIRNLQAMESMDNNDGSSRSMIHHLWRAFQHTSSNLKSAYETVVGKEPVVSSFTNMTNAGLDYIFYSSSTLDTVGILEMIDSQVVWATGGTPTRDIPSDHLSVKSVFRLK